MSQIITKGYLSNKIISKGFFGKIGALMLIKEILLTSNISTGKEIGSTISTGKEVDSIITTEVQKEADL